MRPVGVGGPSAEHPAARAGLAGDQVKDHASCVQFVLPRGEARVVVAVYR